MPACHLEPQDKKAFIDAVGEELVRKHGKKKHYEPREAKPSKMPRAKPATMRQ